MTADIKSILGDGLAYQVDVMLRHHKGSWPDAAAFIRSAVESYIRSDRPDFIGPQCMSLPLDWPWPPDEQNPEHHAYYDFSQGRYEKEER